MLTKKLIFPAAFTLAAVFSAGCETMPPPESVADPLAEVRAVAEEALRTANTAAYDAATAKDMALSAQEAADMAQETANMSQACCDTNTRRLNVMAHEAMKSK